MLGTIGDLAAADSDPDRMTFIEYLSAYLSEEASRDVELDRPALAAAAERVDTGEWSWLLRGCYGSMLKTALPEARAGRVSNVLERSAIAVARAWEVVRLDHMGCLIPLAMMIAAGWVAGFGLSKLLGKPARAAWLPGALYWAWILWALLTVRTHFSGHETIGFKVRAGAIYFALLIGALLAAVLIRIG